MFTLLLVTYIATVVGWFLVCLGLTLGVKFIDKDKEGARKMARAALWAPIWPISTALFIKNTAFPKKDD